MNLVGDVGGQKNALVNLWAQMPVDDLLCVGDLNDRGPDTRGVIDFVMENGDSLMGNHEHLMLDALMNGGYYEHGLWYLMTKECNNGGHATLESYYSHWDNEKITIQEFRERAMKAIPKEHIEWLKTRPLFYNKDGLFVSHAARDKNKKRSLEDCADLGKGFNEVHDQKSEYSLLWNRGNPRKIEGQFQVYGHNASHDPKFFSEKFPDGFPYYVEEHKPYAACIDTSRARVLTGLHWPSMKIYQQPY